MKATKPKTINLCWRKLSLDVVHDFTGFATESIKEIIRDCEYQQWPQDWKRSVFIPIRKKGNAEECSNYCTIALVSHASKVMLKILQASLQQYMNCELPYVQDVFRKGRGNREQNVSIH